jgi:prephenate dehydrogenase
MRNTITIVGAAGKMGKWFFDYFINIKNGYYNLEKRLNIVIDKILLYDIKDINYIYAHQNFNKEVVIVSTNISESIKMSDIIVFCTPLKEIINLINFNFDS